MRNKNQKMKIAVCLLLGVFCLSLVSAHAQRYVAQMNYLPTTHGKTGASGQQYYKDRIKKIAELQYNTILISLGVNGLEFTAPREFSALQFSNAKLEEIIQYSFDQGLEPIVHVHLASKIGKGATVKKLIEKYPAIVSSVNNPIFGRTQNPYFVFPAEGARPSLNMTQGIYKPVIDWITARYPAQTGARSCKFINIGGDEFDTNVMQAFGTANGQDASQAFAKIINDIVDYVQTKPGNIKAVLWGDKLLSRNLGLAGGAHGVSDWNPDARLRNLFMHPKWRWNALFAQHPIDRNESPPESPYTTHKAVNYIDANNRKSMIIADWHYGDKYAIKSVPERWEYPSIDYFNALNFDSVWVTTWYTEVARSAGGGIYQNARMFTEYGRWKGAGGYMASVWFTDIPWRADFFQSDVILEDSIALFKRTWGTYALSQFSSDKFWESKWKRISRGSPPTSVAPVYTGGAGTSEPDAYLRLVVPGNKGVGAISVDPNTAIPNAHFNQEIRLTMTFDSAVKNGGKVKMALTGHQSQWWKNFIMFEAQESASGLRFKIDQKGGSQINFWRSGLSIARGDTLHVRIRNKKVVKFTFWDKSTGVTHALWSNGYLIKPLKTQFSGGRAYTMIEWIAPSGAPAEVRIGRIISERYWY